jgi:hypothetical protein
MRSIIEQYFSQKPKDVKNLGNHPGMLAKNIFCNLDRGDQRCPQGCEYCCRGYTIAQQLRRVDFVAFCVSFLKDRKFFAEVSLFLQTLASP